MGEKPTFETLMSRVEEVFAYSLVDPLHYESLGEYRVHNPRLENLLRNRLTGQSYTIHRRSVWFEATVGDMPVPDHGWKIHVSSDTACAVEVLSIVLQVLVPRRITFKVLVDHHMLALCNSKRWPRSAAGKFITIYPPTTSVFIGIAQTLARLLTGYDGPYVLSDVRYPESKNVFYRYGQLIVGRSVDPFTGRNLYSFAGPDGQPYVDKRHAYVSVPPWVTDPFHPRGRAEAAPAVQRTGPTLLYNGRFAVSKALWFSSAGGVYVAQDRKHANTEVVIKEARPFIISGRSSYASDLLRREARLLRELSGTHISPKYVDYFSEWENHYLVMEHLEGRDLRGFLASRYAALNVHLSRKDAEQYLSTILPVYDEIAAKLEEMHRRGIVFTDISLYNIFVCDSDAFGRVRFIDFEAASERLVDGASGIGTPGFFDAEGSGQKSAPPVPEDDYYGFGMLLLSSVIPITAITSLDHDAIGRIADAAVRELHFPEAFPKVVAALTSSPPEHRMRPVVAMKALNAPTHDGGYWQNRARLGDPTEVEAG